MPQSQASFRRLLAKEREKPGREVPIAPEATILLIFWIPPFARPMLQEGALSSRREGQERGLDRQRTSERKEKTMKRYILMLLAGIAIGGLAGCHLGGGAGLHTPRASYLGDGPVAASMRCPQCHGVGCPLCTRGGRMAEGSQLADPGAAQVSYPYYTVRGPRDYLNPNPQGIGP